MSVYMPIVTPQRYYFLMNFHFLVTLYYLNLKMDLCVRKTNNKSVQFIFKKKTNIKTNNKY